MIKKVLVFLLFIASSTISISQTSRVRLLITAQGSKECIPYAVVENLNTGKNYVANEAGIIQVVMLSNKSCKLRVTALGYKTIDFDVVAATDTSMALEFEALELEEVRVYGERKTNLLRTQSGKISVPLRVMANVPKFIGEPDLLKAITIFPGVTSGMDGYSAIMVRGGNNDQNLYLLDDCPVFNINHLGGFTSLINTNSLKHVEIYKNSFPSHYGGKLSGVLDIKLRDGNKTEYHGEFSLGLVPSGMLVEGPIIKNRLSFLVSARVSYFDLINR